MKKLLLAVAVMMFVVGCSKEPKPEEPDFKCRQGGQLAPKWTCIPEVEGGVGAVGSAKPNAGRDVSLQLNEAMSNARDSLSRRIEVKVKNMIKNWKRATGSGEDQTFEKNLESVSKQTAQQTLQGSRQLEYWRQDDGTIWVLVGMKDNDKIIKQVQASGKTSFKNDEALWQQFQSKKAMDELDAELSKN